MAKKKLNKNLIAREIAALEGGVINQSIAQIKEAQRFHLIVLKRLWNSGNEAEIIEMIKAAK